MLSFLTAQKDHTTRIKICGITRPEDAHLCIESGVDAIGINFWPKSKRYAGEARNLEWLRELAGEIPRVGVFVNGTIPDIEDWLAMGFIDVAQFHGDETPEYTAHFSDWKIDFIKALGVANPESLEIAPEHDTTHFLLDAYCPGEYGGSGKTFDWELAKQFVDQHPQYQVMLAGGLNKDNLRAAVDAVRPAAVDIAGGSEASPGIKDPDLIKQLVDSVRI